MQVGVIPADARQHSVAAAFEARGDEVVYLTLSDPLPEIVLFPMPVSEDGVTVFANGDKLTDWFVRLQGRTVYGGRVSEAVQTLAAQYGVTFWDHFKQEEEIIRNIIPTVEGALQLAMEQTPFTLHGSAVLVCGYGRIGKLLSRHLAALGAVVTVSARKGADLAWCQTLGYGTVFTADLQACVGKQRIIFNTVPTLLFDRTVLDKIPSEALIIDLASAPGGVDFAYAASSGKRALQALGLPAKVAPRTAGEIICRTIMEREENTRG
ncbi:MAG: dipicolinate synthase subunit DpsA [Clostridia bacterium]|nr:dipicolinate synthase subunit DpsA [Clostridia bacterium]